MSSTAYATWCRPGPRLARYLPTGGVGIERPEQLDVTVADVEQGGLDALGLNGLAVRERHAERLLVEGERPLEVVGGDADVIYPAEHGLGSLRSGQGIAF